MTRGQERKAHLSFARERNRTCALFFFFLFHAFTCSSVEQMWRNQRILNQYGTVSDDARHSISSLFLWQAEGSDLVGESSAALLLIGPPGEGKASLLAHIYCQLEENSAEKAVRVGESTLVFAHFAGASAEAAEGRSHKRSRLRPSR